MTTRVLLSVALGLALGGNLLAQEPGDPDYVPDPEAVDEYERLGEEEGSDYELDGDAFDEAADQAGLNAPQVVPPTGSEIDEFRAGLEAHWGGNLPALWAYLDSIDPAGGDNPEPPGEGNGIYRVRGALGLVDSERNRLEISSLWLRKDFLANALNFSGQFWQVEWGG